MSYLAPSLSNTSSQLALGVTNHNTLTGATALTAASTYVQIFTGAATQTGFLPLASGLGSGVSVAFQFANSALGTVTLQRSGIDTFPQYGHSTTYELLSASSARLFSDGARYWYVG